jgi:hypothetical protein
MDFEHFALSRDMGYLGFMMAGIALGLLLQLCPSVRPAKKKHWIIPVSMLFFSAAVVFFAVSLIYSQGRILFLKAWYLPGLISAGVFTFAGRFPLAAAFPLLLLAGALAVVSGIISRPFVRLTGPETVLAVVSGVQNPNSGDRAYTVQISKTGASLFSPATGTELEIQALRLHPAPALPFFGGSVLSAVSGIFNGGEAVYTLRLPGLTGLSQKNAEKRRFFGVKASLLKETLSFDQVQPGFPLRVADTGDALVFLPR